MRTWKPTPTTLQIENIGYFEIKNGSIFRSPGSLEAPIPIEPMSFFTAMLQLNLSTASFDVYDVLRSFIYSHGYGVDDFSEYPKVQKCMPHMKIGPYMTYNDEVACTVPENVDKFHLFSYLQCKWRK